MGNVGSFGKINFYCKSVRNKNKMLSFHDLSRSSNASFAEHERNGEKPYLEFSANGLDELTLTIEADARYGIKPLEVESKLFDRKSKGTADYFVLGGKKIGDNPFVITSISENFKLLHSDGRPVRIGFQITLKEYANKTNGSSKTVTRKSGTSTNSTLVGASEEKTAKETCTDSYVVKDGDCLWNIAKSFYGSGSQYTRIYNANKDKISNPNKITTGMVLKIPK